MHFFTYMKNLPPHRKLGMVCAFVLKEERGNVHLVSTHDRHKRVVVLA